MTRWQIETAIADKTCKWERANLAALGHDGLDIAMMGFGAYCGVLLIAVEDERPAVWQAPRTVTGRSASVMKGRPCGTEAKLLNN